MTTQEHVEKCRELGRMPLEVQYQNGFYHWSAHMDLGYRQYQNALEDLRREWPLVYEVFINNLSNPNVFR